MLRKFRGTYWSNGPVAKLTAKWLGAPPRPSFATMEEWNVFDKQQATKFKLQDKIENALRTAQNIWMFFPDVWYTIECYFNNRFVTQTHVLRTGLDKGQWHEFDTRLVYGMFNSFVEFIEKEKTLKTLNWELTLVEKCEWFSREEAKQQPEYGQPTHQAKRAREQLELYTWWKSRESRPDPFEASGLEKLFKDSRKKDDSTFAAVVENSDTNNEEIRKAMSAKRRQIAEDYDREDEEMLIRLIRLRGSLWT